MTRAAIDIGSNSILLLVMDGDRVVHDEARVVGLGRGMGDTGVFRPERMEAVIAALRDYAAVASAHGVAPAAIRAVATSASRRALNATTFYANVRRQTGINVEIISGEEEARLTYLGGLTGLSLPTGPVLLCDPGGGSTEVILGDGGKILHRVSLEIGSVRLTDAFLGYERVDPPALARCRAAVDEAVATVHLPLRPRAAVAVAGTATSLAATNLGLAAYDPSLVHNSVLTAAQLRTWGDRLLAASPAERRSLIVSSPDRADTLLAGVTILLAVLALSGRQSYRISDRGLRYGALGN